MLTSIITPAGANIHIPGKGMKNVPVNSPVYNEVVSVIMDGLDLPEDQQLTDAEKIHRILRLIDREVPLRNSANGQFEVVDGNIKIEGEFVPVVISKRIIDFMNLKYDYRPLVEFWKRLRNNPSERSRTELLSFLEQNGIPVTKDGYFVAYKYVNGDYSSTRDSRYVNAPGNIVSKPREECDADSSVTCSHGLHVASWGYVQNSQNIVAVKVDPTDVVSVPYDYNGQKMRVCRYQVLENISGEYTQPRFEESEKVELNREQFEYMGITGFHKEAGFGTWHGQIKHKNALLNEVSYSGRTLTELHTNFVSIIDEIIKDTRFNYLRQRRDGNGGFVKTKG
jgi:hypothetical protein